MTAQSTTLEQLLSEFDIWNIRSKFFPKPSEELAQVKIGYEPVRFKIVPPFETETSKISPPFRSTVFQPQIKRLHPQTIDLNGEEILDWDFYVEMKPKNKRVIKGKIIKKGRLTPLSFKESWLE